MRLLTSRLLLNKLIKNKLGERNKASLLLRNLLRRLPPRARKRPRRNSLPPRSRINQRRLRRRLLSLNRKRNKNLKNQLK